MNRYSIAAFRATSIVLLLLALRAVFLVHLNPETWQPLVGFDYVVFPVAAATLIYPLCLRTKPWTVALLLAIAYFFAQLASTGSPLSGWYWLVFAFAILGFLFFIISWTLELRRRNILAREQPIDEEEQHPDRSS
ncbi:hypothetical protein EON81_23105 [bacterium]|nr:MAG: hypothetical protein EON81_23105 [bacterium]